MHGSSGLWVGALALAFTSMPSVARADICGPTPSCEELIDLVPIGSSTPVGGVLAMQPVFGEFPWVFDSAGLEGAITVTVTYVEEMMTIEVPGRVAAVAAAGVVTWVPEEPLVEGVVYDVRAAVDNGPLEGLCGAENFEVTWSTTATKASSLPPTAPPVGVVTEMLRLEDVGDLDTVVCCDEAYPVLLSANCSEVGWDTGFCAASERFGTLDVLATFDVGGLDATGQVGYHVQGVPISLATGEAAWSVTERRCGPVVAVQLATGTVMQGPELCVGESVADQLGSHRVDPTDALAQGCVGEPYTCEVSLVEWDPEACTPYVAGTLPADSCFCSGGGSPVGGLAVGLLLLLRRRRSA